MRVWRDCCDKHNCSLEHNKEIFITKMIDKGINPFIVQKLVNHRSIQTTQRYYNADPRRLLNAVEMVEF